MAIKKSSINLKLPVKIWKCEGIYLCYNIKYDISGYGKTKNKAKESFLINVKEILRYSNEKV